MAKRRAAATILARFCSALCSTRAFLAGTTLKCLAEAVLSGSHLLPDLYGLLVGEVVKAKDPLDLLAQTVLAMSCGPGGIGACSPPSYVATRGALRS